jgi:hypothetical protein
MRIELKIPLQMSCVSLESAFLTMSRREAQIVEPTRLFPTMRRAFRRKHIGENSRKVLRDSRSHCEFWNGAKRLISEDAYLAILPDGSEKWTACGIINKADFGAALNKQVDH